MGYYNHAWALVHTVLDKAGNKFEDATILFPARGRADNYYADDNDKCKVSKKRAVEESDNDGQDDQESNCGMVNVQEPDKPHSERKGAGTKRHDDRSTKDSVNLSLVSDSSKVKEQTPVKKPKVRCKSMPGRASSNVCHKAVLPTRNCVGDCLPVTSPVHSGVPCCPHTSGVVTVLASLSIFDSFYQTTEEITENRS
jgi:hypothetical protein